MKIFGEFVVTFLLSLACSALVFYTVRLAGSFVYFWLVFLIVQLCGIGMAFPLLNSLRSLFFELRAYRLYLPHQFCVIQLYHTLSRWIQVESINCFVLPA